MAKTPDHDIFGLLGKPLDAAEVRGFLAATGTKPPRVPKGHDEDVLCVGNEAGGLAMELVRASDYDEEYATRAAAKRRTDWVVAGVDLLGAGANTKKTKAYSHALPFGLAFGDAADAVIAKLGKRPASKDPGVGYAHAWWFRIGEAKVLAALDARKRLIWLRVVPLDRVTAQAIARKALRTRTRT